MPHRYDPNQPRVARGSPDGGQWTRDGSASGAVVQPVFLGPGLPATVPFIGGALADDVATAFAAAAAMRFAWLSLFNGPRGRAVLKFRAGRYRPNEERGQLYLDDVKWLSRADVEDVCKMLQVVQTYTDDAVIAVRADKEHDFSDPARFGTEVHRRVEIEVEASQDPDFVAEDSYMKWKEETYGTEAWKRFEAERKKAASERKAIPYGTKDSIRVDVLENLGNGTVCVYDVKTGRRSPLTGPRMAEIARAVYLHYGTRAKTIIVTEVTPFANSSRPESAR